MCGIAGIARQDGAPVDATRLARMTAALIHRGPDSTGRYLNNGVGLGVRRLRIIDLVTGDQPIRAGGRYAKLHYLQAGIHEIV